MTDITPPDPDAVAAIAGVIDEAASQAVDANEVLEYLDLPEGPSDLGMVASVQVYGGPSRQAGRWERQLLRADGCLRGRGRNPPRFDSLPDEVRALWEAVADQVAFPIAQARLNDICSKPGGGTAATMPAVRSRATCESLPPMLMPRTHPRGCGGTWER